MRLIDFQTVEAYVQSWTKQKGVGVWDFKGEKDNLQEDGKSKCLVSRCLLGHAEKMGHREDSGLQALPSFPRHT